MRQIMTRVVVAWREISSSSRDLRTADRPTIGGTTITATSPTPVRSGTARTRRPRPAWTGAGRHAIPCPTMTNSAVAVPCYVAPRHFDSLGRHRPPDRVAVWGVCVKLAGARQCISRRGAQCVGVMGKVGVPEISDRKRLSDRELWTSHFPHQAVPPGLPDGESGWLSPGMRGLAFLAASFGRALAEARGRTIQANLPTRATRSAVRQL